MRAALDGYNQPPRKPARRNPTPLGAYHLLVIGAGPAGLVAARAAAAPGARVALIERLRLGGDCLNQGCVPSKTMLRSARLYADMRNAANFGVAPPAEIAVDFSAVMDRYGASGRASAGPIRPRV